MDVVFHLPDPYLFGSLQNDLFDLYLVKYLTLFVELYHCYYLVRHLLDELRKVFVHFYGYEFYLIHYDENLIKYSYVDVIINLFIFVNNFDLEKYGRSYPPT